MSIRNALDALILAELDINDFDIHDPMLDEIIQAQRTVQDAAPEMAKWIMEAVPWLKMAKAMLLARANHTTDNGEQHSVAADELRQDCLNQAAKLDHLIDKAEGLL